MVLASWPQSTARLTFFAADNFAALHHMTLNLPKRGTRSKSGVKTGRKTAGGMETASLNRSREIFRRSPGWTRRPGIFCIDSPGRFKDIVLGISPPLAVSPRRGYPPERLAASGYASPGN
jgi:hypothetical protein